MSFGQTCFILEIPRTEDISLHEFSITQNAELLVKLFEISPDLGFVTPFHSNQKGSLKFRTNKCSAGSESSAGSLTRVNRSTYSFIKMSIRKGCVSRDNRL